METSPNLAPIKNFDQGLDKGFRNKVPLMVTQRSTRIGFLTLSPKEVIVVVVKIICLIVQNVEESMIVSS